MRGVLPMLDDLVLSLATLKMNGFGSGMSDGTIYTTDWENDARCAAHASASHWLLARLIRRDLCRYTFYQVTILNIRDDQLKHGWAVYSWQWNYV